MDRQLEHLGGGQRPPLGRGQALPPDRGGASLPDRAIAVLPRSRVGAVPPEAVAARDPRRDGRLARARRPPDPQNVPQGLHLAARLEGAQRFAYGRSAMYLKPLSTA